MKVEVPLHQSHVTIAQHIPCGHQTIFELVEVQWCRRSAIAGPFSTVFAATIQHSNVQARARHRTWIEARFLSPQQRRMVRTESPRAFLAYGWQALHCLRRLVALEVRIGLARLQPVVRVHTLVSSSTNELVGSSIVD